MRTLLLLIGLVGFCASAQNEYVLEGTLGKSPIYFTFWDHPNDKHNRITEPRYFYENSLKDIVLEGKFEKEQYVFGFKQEQFKLTKKNDGTFSGTWSNKNGEPLPVVLRPVKWKDYGLQDGESIDAFNILKSRFIRFKKDSTAVFNGKKLDWYSEIHSATPMFRLTDDFPKNTLDRVNPVLESLQQLSALMQLECNTRFDYSNGDNIQFEITLGYLDDNLLGFNFFSFYDCGGAHPDSENSGWLIDLHSGKIYDIDAVLAFDATVPNASDFKKFAAYRQNVFAPKLNALLQQQYHFKKPVDDGEEHCDYTDLEHWQFPSWNFTAKGILFIPSFPHAMAPCSQSFLLPFEVLRAFKNPAFPYRL